MAFGRRSSSCDDENEGDFNDKGMEQAPKKSSSTFSTRSSSSSSQPSQPSYKFGILERLNDAVEMKLTNSTTVSHRSPDLIPLMKSFDIMRKKLRQMIATAKKYHQSMINLDSDRIQVMACYWF
jgi:hypothetical protein